MTLIIFCARNHIPENLMREFAEWLGSVKRSELPEVQWRVMWEDFIKDRTND
jgi:hypothetical protein